MTFSESHSSRSLWISIAMLAVLTSAGCAQGPAAPRLEGPFDAKVLYVGNSLTATHDVPRLVESIAESTGLRIGWQASIVPSASLEDQWRRGVEQLIRDTEADFVVLQQGASSLPESQVHLRGWTEIFDPVIRESGGVPALYMVWPDDSRLHVFDAVRDAYREAAIAVDGLFIPAGEAWRQAWAVDGSLRFYGSDGFHPSRLGAEVAALTIFRVLFEQDVTVLPDRIEPTSDGLPIIDWGSIGPVIRAAVEAAVQEWRNQPSRVGPAAR